MNQKSKGFVLIVIACLWMWGGCDGVSRENDAAYETAEVLKEGYETGIEETTEGSVQDREKNCFEKTFGSYELPKDWIESEEHSTAERFFYVKTGDEKKDRPDNISVHEGEDPYAQSEHEAFREAILRQLSAQISGDEDVTLYGEGYTAEGGSTVYRFTIEESETGIVTTMYYIVGDYRYVLIHETNFTGDPSADEAARQVADTFRWDV